jgi:hypothetical protein
VTDSATPSSPVTPEGTPLDADLQAQLDGQVRDIADVPAVELITTVSVHLMSAAAVNLGLAEDENPTIDLDEARKIIQALAGLLTASMAFLGDQHVRPLRDGLRSLQLAFREASPVPDPIGKGPGEDLTGPVFA